MSSIQSSQEISARWISEALKTRVSHLEVSPAVTYGRSQVFHLDVNYSSPSKYPDKLFLKFLMGFKEYKFYSDIAAAMNDPMVVPHYYLGFDEKSLGGVIIMPDMRLSHYQTKWPLPPKLNNCKDIMLVLARLHAHWWNHPRLTSDLSEAAKERNWGDRLLMAADSLPQFFEFIADRLSKSRVEILNKVSIQFTHLISERTSNRPITLNHSDSHAWNFLFPKDPHKNSTVLYDWHSWDIGSGTNDLAYFMGLHWYPERRMRFEIELLRIYFDKLINLGVKGYNWEDCQLDYRLSMLRTMLIPIWQWAEGIPEMIWWSHLDRSFIAFEDLKLGEMID